MTPSPDDRIGAPEDELAFERVEARPPRKPWGRRLVIMVALIVAAGVGWYQLSTRMDLGNQENVPVVRATVAPVKIKPADPGGLDVPDRDKLVYDRLNGEGAGTAVESLLPPPEEPMTIPETAVPATTTVTAMPEAMPESAPDAMNQSAAPAVLSAEVTQAPVSLEPSPTPTPAPAPEPVPEAGPEVMPEAVPEAALAPPPASAPAPAPEPASATVAPDPLPESAAAATASANGQFRIQLAALRTHAGAEDEWNRLRKLHPDILGSLNLFVVMVDKGGNDGIYYRLQAGNMASRENAKAVCDKLASRNVACLAKVIEK